MNALAVINSSKAEDSQLLLENMSMKQTIGIMKGRESLRRVIADQFADLIVDVPIEYVKYCTRNFTAQRRLGEGGSGDVFLAMDNQVDPTIHYVVKRVQVDHHENQYVELFRRELEVNKANTSHTFVDCTFLDLLSVPPWHCVLIFVLLHFALLE